MSGKPVKPAQMHPAIRRRIDERLRLLRAACRYAERLRQALPLEWVLVAGSVARGDFHAGSDVDVLVVSDALPAGPLERAELLYRFAEGSIEPKGFTRAELAAALARRSPLVLEAASQGVVVYPQGASLEAFRRWMGLPGDGA